MILVISVDNGLMRLFSLAFACTVLSCSVGLSAQQKVKTGPQVGSKAPDFKAVDQDGRIQNLETISGPKGAILVFFRSADW